MGAKLLGQSVFGQHSASTQVLVPVYAGFTLGRVAVLSKGAPNLEFLDAGNDSCIPGNTYHAGDTCYVNVTFAPTRPASQQGAVVLRREQSSGGDSVRRRYG